MQQCATEPGSDRELPEQISLDLAKLVLASGLCFLGDRDVGNSVSERVGQSGVYILRFQATREDILRDRRASALATVVIALVGMGANDGLASAVAAASKPRPCSTKGLRVSYRSGSASYSVKVSGLVATTAACSNARSLATAVATNELHRKTVPATIQGFAVHVRVPCSGCTPVWHVTATRGTARITFELRGGA